MPLRSRFAILATLYVVVFIAGAVLTARSVTSWSRDIDERRAFTAANLRVARMTSAYLLQDTGVRGYLITGRDEFLQTFQQGVDDVEVLIGEIHAIGGLPDAASAALAAAETAAEGWRNDVAEIEIGARRSGDQDVIDRLVTDDLGRSRFNDLRAALGSLSDRLTTSAAAANDDAVTARRWALGVLIATLVGAVALTGVMIVAVERWVVRPLGRVAAGAERVRKGGEAELFQGGAPELATLVRAVDDMQRAIRSERDAAITSREAIEQNAVLALQIRSALTRDMGDYPAGWSVGAGLRAAEGLVAGDCYDVSLLGPAEIGLVVLDIAGHGATPAVSAFRCNELLKVALRNGLDPGDALGWLYDQEHGLGDLFFTAFVATIDTETGECHYANAGHPAAILARAGREAEPLSPTGPLVFSHVPPGWQTRKVTIEPGTMLGVYTDGLVEARSPDREFFGERRVFDLFSRTDERDAELVVASVLGELSSFHPGRLADDVTLVVLSRAG